MATKEAQISFAEHLVELLIHMENEGYHHAKAGTHQAQLYSQVKQEITILEKK